MTTNTISLERIVEEPSRPTWRERAKQSVRNYAIDTAAKLSFYAPMMATVEAGMGLDAGQIMRSRAMSAIVDLGAARICGKVMNYTRKRFHAEKSRLRSYLADTTAMIGTYVPTYMGILAANGASLEQIGCGAGMCALSIAATARPYGKYVLDRFRKAFGYVN